MNGIIRSTKAVTLEIPSDIPSAVHNGPQNLGFQMDIA
jgi:hypothetical protein